MTRVSPSGNQYDDLECFAQKGPQGDAMSQGAIQFSVVVRQIQNRER